MKKIPAENRDAFLGSLLLTEAIGALGAVFTVSAIPVWYAGLQKPSFTPPDWVFGPVWTILYALMAVAAFLVWQRRKEYGAKQALWLYGVQLVLNFLWTVIFFGLHMPGLALMEILVLLAVIVAMTGWFARYNGWAAALLVPYILWLSFATALNAGIWILNG